MKDRFGVFKPNSDEALFHLEAIRWRSKIPLLRSLARAIRSSKEH